jgi:hypothetical protein
MHVDDIADRIAIARADELDCIVRDMWTDCTHGLLTEGDMEALDEAARTRREELQTRRTETRPKARPVHSRAPRAPSRRPQRSPDKQRSIERRRRLVASGPLPPPLAARFTWGEIAVMRIIGDECRAKGYCDLCIDAIAARAGVHRTTVQNALREAQGRGEVPGTPIISVQERRRPGQKSLTNVIHNICAEWRDWLRKGPRYATGAPQGEGSKSTARPIRVDSKREGRPQKPPPWGIPDGVYPCEEVA